MQLSIIIPVYNVEKYIIRCLESIINQAVDISLYEIIVVDDESPDKSVALIQDHYKDIKNITIISQKNKGLGGARNTGLANANGEYVWFIDSDDTVTENSIERILNAISTEAEIYVFDVNKITQNSIIQDSLYHIEIDNMKGYQIINYFLISQVWKNVYKRDFLITHELKFREHFLHEDGEFNMRTITIANRVSYKKTIIYNYFTTNNSSIMNNIKLRNQVDLLYYFNSSTEFRQSYLLSTQQEYCLQQYLRSMLGVLFKNVLSLSASDVVQFRHLLEQYRAEILNTIKKDRLYYFLKVYSMLYFVSKRYYNLIFNKSLKLQKQ